MFRLHLLAFALTAFALPSGYSATVQFQDLGVVEAVKSAEFRLHGGHAMFLIEDQWEHERCKLLMPRLPDIDLETESLLVILSSQAAKQSLDSVETDGDTLVVNVSQDEQPPVRTRSYRPPDFLVFRLPRWNGPVRFNLNDQTLFTLLRRSELEDQVTDLWEEFLRIHSGGRPTQDQLVQYYQRIWPDTPDDDIRKLISRKDSKYRSIEPAAIYQMIAVDLVDIRAKPLIPKIFALIDTMGMHDKAFNPCWEAIVGIGGDDVIPQCEKALQSWNQRSRHAGMLILRDLGFPSTKPIAMEHLSDLQEPVARGAMTLLDRIGITSDDVPEIAAKLDEIMGFYRTPQAERPNVRHYSGDVAGTMMYVLGGIGTEAIAALRTLERISGDDRLPTTFRSKARETCEKIERHAASGN